jgi:rod shape-determining protein MreD
MIRRFRASVVILSVLILQITVLPAFLADPFKPNLVLIVVVWLGLKGSPYWGALISYLLGSALDAASGVCFGMNGFSSLLTFFILQNISHRLYTDSRYLMTLAVFVATIATGVMHLLLMAIFSVSDGIYATLLGSLLPHSVVNALIASVVFNRLTVPTPEEAV